MLCKKALRLRPRPYKIWIILIYLPNQNIIKRSRKRHELDGLGEALRGYMKLKFESCRTALEYKQTTLREDHQEKYLKLTRQHTINNIYMLSILATYTGCVIWFVAAIAIIATLIVSESLFCSLYFSGNSSNLKVMYILYHSNPED